MLKNVTFNHEKLINLVMIHLIRRAENAMFTAFFLPLQVFVGFAACVHSKGQKNHSTCVVSFANVDRQINFGCKGLFVIF